MLQLDITVVNTAADRLRRLLAELTAVRGLLDLDLDERRLLPEPRERRRSLAAAPDLVGLG
jgi:hypothetical protein